MRQALALLAFSRTDLSCRRRDPHSPGPPRQSAAKARRLLALIVTLLLLAGINSACTLPQTQRALPNSYRLAQFRLEQCRKMGANELDGEHMEAASRLSGEIEAMLAAERWWAAKGSLRHLEETLALLMERLKVWDPDGDGLSTYAEFMLYGTSGSDADTDGDGFLDGSEVLLYETDPLDPCAVPLGVEPERARTRPCPALQGFQLGGPPLARIFHESLAPTADLAVLPGVLADSRHRFMKHPG